MSYSLSFSQAVLIMIYVADKIDQKFYEFINTKQISETLNIAKPTAVKILNSLSRSGLIETAEGAKGGVRLAKKPEDITILDIFKAIEQEKPLFQSRFEIKVTGTRPGNAQKAILNIYSSAEKAMQDQLSSITVRNILNELA